MSVQMLPAPTPGLYPGSGQAQLLRQNCQQYLFQGTPVVATNASIAVQLERRQGGYPWGAAFEVVFAASPGASPEVDIQFAETDTDANYVTVGTITVFNTGNVGRYDMPNTVFPKYVRAIIKTLATPGKVSVLVTR